MSSQTLNAGTERDPLLPQSNSQAQVKRRRRRNVFLILFTVFASAVTVSLIWRIIWPIPSPSTGPGQGRDGRDNPAVLARGRHGAVAAENVVCSQIGVDVLRDGGNAVDAAIAATLCTGTLNMFSSGIGGGGFMLVRSPNANYSVVDFRETAPALANTTMYKGRIDKAQFGGLSVGTPGELRGLQTAHTKWGKLEWKRLVMPSVDLARQTTVSKQLATFLKRYGSFIYEDPVWADIFVNPETGRLVEEGQLIKRTAYARTLETIAEKGADAFYHGSIAESIVSTIQKTGGILTLSDLAEYTALIKPALTAKWGGRRIVSTPAPTSGPVLLALLQMLDTFRPPPLMRDGLKMHRFIESLKFAFSLRTHMGDPSFLHGVNASFVENIPSPETAKKLAARITHDTHDLGYYDPLFDITEDHGTMHVSVVDKDGGAVSLTSTVNLVFGSRLMDEKTGVILNDEMDDTSTPGVANAFGLFPSPFNYPEPNKRPLSSISPTILEHSDGSIDLVIGASGGSRIFGAVAQTILNKENGLDLSESIEAPRLHHQLLPPYIIAETTFPEATLDSLRSRKHNLTYVDINKAVAEVQAVSVKGKGRLRTVFAASDSRKGGIAVAY